jgi:hypothetical protein
MGGARAYGFAHSFDGIGAVAFADAFSDTVGRLHRVLSDGDAIA